MSGWSVPALVMGAAWAAQPQASAAASVRIWRGRDLLMLDFMGFHGLVISRGLHAVEIKAWRRPRAGMISMKSAYGNLSAPIFPLPNPIFIAG